MCVSNADKGHVCLWSRTVEIAKLFRLLGIGKKYFIENI